MKRSLLMAILISLILMPIKPIPACTGFTMSQGETVLVGHNEDWYDPDPYIRIYPSEGVWDIINLLASTNYAISL
ncbi:MAG: hypothetical protein DRN27_09625 [Thermoplasmata archaeon]|nr:MAG: hypothetical protein DRN27_09625 [Thermoplasmata archaeon]